jgi:nucleoid-associated protein YgaU
MSSLEFRSSEPIDQAGSNLNSGSDSIAREVQNQFSGASLGKDAIASMPAGTDAMSGLAIPPGGDQAVSPLINMITKMPGHIGFFSSFFEALGAFFGPQLDMLGQLGEQLGAALGNLNHSILGDLGGDSVSSLLSSLKPEHFALNLSLLPGNAPIFGQLGNMHGHLSGSFNSDLLSSKLNASLNHSNNMFTSDIGRNSLNVGGSGSMAKLQFEGQGHLSGPGLTSNGTGPQIAGNNRLFSDSIGSAGHNLNGQSLAQSVPMQQPAASSLNVGSSTFGNNDLLAMNNESFQSTVGDMKSSADSAIKGGSENLGGLKAKSLSLDGSSHDLKADALGDKQALSKHDAVSHKADGVEKVAAKDVKHEVAKHDVKDIKDVKEAKELRTHKTFDRTSHSVKNSHQTASNNNAAQTKAVTPKAAPEATAKANVEQPAVNEQQQFEQQQMQQQQEIAQNPQQNGQPDAAGDATQAVPETQSYTIKAGDNLWNIAKDKLGDATKWTDIYKMNSDVLGANPELIRPGTTIQLPGAPGADVASAAGSNVAQYTVQPGDNLWDIAHEQLGDATKWGDIYKANTEIIGSNPGMIHPGQTLNLGGVDPASMQLSSTGVDPSQTLSANPAAASNQFGTPNAGGPAGGMSAGDQVAQTPVESYSSEVGQSADIQGQAMQQPAMHQQAMQQPAQANGQQISSNSFSNYESMPVAHNLPDPASLGEKVIPAKAAPDAIIQPAHAATPHLDGGKSVVSTNLGNDLLNALKKRR